ncbi:transcription factor MYB98-like [Salvia miltiorrhiza]|uniref:transcription factor MYB98-like n=1 Tax=Salvia miltiorrhiza TaxID=226208 RepID=UPI0025AD669B|nr:transcription factor MYB98-like [Salvia miltiorrhiza]
MELNCPYQILESNSQFRPSPQNCNIFPIQNLDTVSEKLNSNSEVSNKRPKQRHKKQKEKEKETCYKGPWTKSEDRKLRSLVKQYGYKKWATIAKHMAPRIGKQCRERWHNNLRPNISKSIVWSDEEEMMIIEGRKRFGNRWSRIARLIPGRSENDVKNQWNKTQRRLFSNKNIQRPKRLRGLYQSTVLENYIRKHFLNTTADAAAPPPPPIYKNNALIHTPPADPPLSVDDYQIDDCVPYFTFESAAIDGVTEASPLIDYAVAATFDEKVDEEINFLRSLFGGINV